jgi:pimeloyl-[acyl-carrier protein] synthase
MHTDHPSMNELDSILVSREFMYDPYPLLRQLREQDPVHWSDSIGGWIATRYDDIVTTFRDVRRYSNEGRLARAVEYLPPDMRTKFCTFEEHYRTKGLLHSDPPDHTRLRALVTKAFTVSIVEAMRPRIQQIVDEVLDRAEDARKMDAIADLAIVLPFTVLAEILGTPRADQHLLKEWADGLLAFQGVNKPGEQILERSQKALIEMKSYLAELVAERRRQPREDLISKLAAAESEREQLSQSELLNTCITLLVAGHETTTSLIGNGLYLLLRHRDQWEELKAHPDLLTSAIEEILRFESPVARQPRLMKEDAQLGGRHIRQGEMVFQMLNAANRDPAYFAEPDRFDIHREKNRHIAFGNGIHFCVGAALARTEAQVVFRTMLRRIPQVHLNEERADWDLTKPNSRMLRTLPVAF